MYTGSAIHLDDSSARAFVSTMLASRWKWLTMAGVAGVLSLPASAQTNDAPVGVTVDARGQPSGVDVLAVRSAGSWHLFCGEQ